MKVNKILIALVSCMGLLPVDSCGVENRFDNMLQYIRSGLSASKIEALAAIATSTAYLMYTDREYPEAQKTAAQIAIGTFVLARSYTAWIESRAYQVNAEIEEIMQNNKTLDEQISALLKKFHSYNPILWGFERDIVWKKFRELNRAHWGL